MTNLGFLVATLPALIGGVIALKAGRVLAGVLLMVGAIMVVGEMAFWLGDTIYSYLRTGDPYTSGTSEGFYYLATGFGVLGTIAIGVGVLLLALQLKAALKETGHLRGILESRGK